MSAERGAKARILRTGLFACFAGSAKSAKGKTCEPSAVVYLRRRRAVVFGNDKPMPASPIFRFAVSGRKAGYRLSHRAYLHPAAPAVTTAIKYEGLTASLDGRYVIASTAFTVFKRFKDAKGRFMSYSALVVWRADGTGTPRFVTYRPAAGDRFSYSVRRQLVCLYARVAKGGCVGDHPHFIKVEALEAIPARRRNRGLLLFGLREAGATEQDRTLGMTILAVPFRITKGRLALNFDADARVYRPAAERWRRPLLASKRFKEDPKRLGQVAISGMTFDRARRRLILVTSYETDDAKTQDDIDAFLWTLPLADFFAGRPPRPVTDRRGRPLGLGHKAEGVTMLDRTTLLVIHDDDRVPTCARIGGRSLCRRSNQAYYSVVRLLGR